MYEFHLSHFNAAIQALNTIMKILERPQIALDDELRGFILEQLQRMDMECLPLGLKVSEAQIVRLIQRLPTATVEEMGHGIAELGRRLRDETETILFFYVPDDKKRYYQFPQEEFGQQTCNRFPSALTDIEEAGKCYALVRYTACVFHLMRVMEIGLRHLGASLHIPSLDPQRNPSWEAILKKCKLELEKPLSERSPEWRADEEFFSSASTNLLAVKNAWRNPVMHVGKEYSEEHTKDIYQAVRGFMRHLALKLHDSLGD